MNRTAPISRPRPPKQTAEKASTVPQNTRTLILKPDAPTPLMQREVTIQGIKMSLGQAMEHLKRTHNTYFLLPTSIKSIINRNLEQYAAHTPQLTFANIQELGQFIEHLTNHALQMSTLSPNQKKVAENMQEILGNKYDADNLINSISAGRFTTEACDRLVDEMSQAKNKAARAKTSSFAHVCFTLKTYLNFYLN